MDINKIHTILGEISLFSKLGKKKCQEIVAHGQQKQYHRSEILPCRSPGHTFCVVLSGELAAVKNTRQSRESTEPLRYTVGDYFLTQNYRINYIQVLEAAELLVFQRQAFNNIVALFLRNLDFFSDLSDKELKAIARGVGLTWYDAGDFLFCQGEAADALYIIIEGEVAMIREDIEDGESIKEVLTSYPWGTFFGERGVLSGENRAASARIEQRTSLLIWPREKIEALAKKYVGVTLSLYRNLAHQLEEEFTACRQAARQIDKITDAIHGAKMAALGQLVAGVAHEINTPVGIISADSYQLDRYWTRIKGYYDRVPQLIQEFYEQGHLQAMADKLGYVLDDHIGSLVKEYVASQIDYLHNDYKQANIERFSNNIHAISDEMKKSSDLIKGIVRSLSNFARLDEAELKHVDIHEGLDTTISLLHHELKYKVEVKKEYGDLPNITCHPNQLNQVFMNLLMNATQALELDKLQGQEKGLIQIRTYREGGWAVIAVTDNGKGIPPENLDKIFLPFFSTKGAGAASKGLGLGLGLTISQKIVQELHLGRIEVKSTPHKETTFFIKLPIGDNCRPSKSA